MRPFPQLHQLSSLLYRIRRQLLHGCRKTVTFVASPAEQESGADWRAVELHPLKSSVFPRRTVTAQSSAGGRFDCWW